jgi:hypothetical protein
MFGVMGFFLNYAVGGDAEEQMYVQGIERAECVIDYII